MQSLISNTINLELLQQNFLVYLDNFSLCILFRCDCTLSFYILLLLFFVLYTRTKDDLKFSQLETRFLSNCGDSLNFALSKSLTYYVTKPLKCRFFDCPQISIKHSILRDHNAWWFVTEYWDYRNFHSIFLVDGSLTEYCNFHDILSLSLLSLFSPSLSLSLSHSLQKCKSIDVFVLV